MPKKHNVEILPRPRTQSRRAASKEALKQMQLLLGDDEDDPVEIPSDDDVIPVEQSPLPPPPPPKKKYKLSHRKSSDGHDRDVIVLKTITNRDAENTLELECWVEQLEEVQKTRILKMQEEEKALQEKLEALVKTNNGQIIHKSDLNTVIEVTEQVQNAVTTTTNVTATPSAPSNLILNNAVSSGSGYQLVMDPRLGLIVGAVNSQTAATPTTSSQKVFQGKVQVAQGLQQAPTTSTAVAAQVTAVARGVRTRRGAKNTPPASPPIPTRTVPQTRSAPAKGPPTIKIVSSGKTTPPLTKKIISTPAPAPTRGRPASSTFTTVRPSETNVEGGLTTGTTLKKIVDLTGEDGRSLPDSREISFNKLQGKTYPSLVVVARPHLRVLDLGSDRPKLDAKVKSVLMHAPTKFTEWLIQQGLVRSEQKCSVHTETQLKLGMYSDVSKFPYSGGYVWISECCPQRFVSVFSGSLFEGSPHPPMVILKLLYHWSCQTNIQNVTQWASTCTKIFFSFFLIACFVQVKVDNLYVKGMYTWLRSVCTVAVHTHVRQIGGPGVKVEIGVISLGTTSQDGNQRQVKVEVLGILESSSKLIRLRAVEPQADGDRNYKKRFSKILEPIFQWVHPQSVLVADLTVDRQTLLNMGFTNVLQSTSNEFGSNRQIMEYLRRIVPRMFQNTLSLLSRQIIQQFLDELVWREWFGTSSLQAFDNLITHLSEQTRYDSGQSLIFRLNKVSQNPFKNWSIPLGNVTKVVENPQKKQRTTRKPLETPKVTQTAAAECNLWFVQKDVLRDHQMRMHVSQRGKHGLIPWNAPRNGVMVPKSKLDKYPCDADVINFGALYFNIPKKLLCKECNSSMDVPKHFPMLDVLGLVRKPDEGPSGLKKSAPIPDAKEEESVAIVIEEDNESSEAEQVEESDASKKMETHEVIAVNVSEQEVDDSERGSDHAEDAKDNVSEDKADEQKDEEEEVEKSEDEVEAEKGSEHGDDKDTNSDVGEPEQTEFEDMDNSMNEKQSEERDKNEAGNKVVELVDSESESDNIADGRTSAEEVSHQNDTDDDEVKIVEAEPTRSECTEDAISSDTGKLVDEPSVSVQKLFGDNDSTEKQSVGDSEITSDDIQNIISDVVGEKSNSAMNFEDVNIEASNMETETDFSAGEYSQKINCRQVEDDRNEVPENLNTGLIASEAAPMEID
ncbi:hypothetical protein NQ315_005904 [Exocentrus adspersus]|uniref:C2H2-type domain-containing protein n=1 Tax=Exocentrus adspersus TaxID=1586481 RepID=A0AAV8VBD1_9CUCU|nr:hypothetical protein NQ315_005904 [Exocentrus adspersus]